MGIVWRTRWFTVAADIRSYPLGDSIYPREGPPGWHHISETQLSIALLKLAWN